MVYGNTLYWHSWTGKAEDLERDHVPDLGVPTETLFEPPALLNLLYPLGEASTPSTSGFFLRRASVERVGGFEEGFKGMFEDQAFKIKMYLKERVFVSGECWDKYRQHPDSCYSIARSTGLAPSTWLFFLGWMAGYLSEQEVEDPAVWELLRKHRSFARVQVHVQERQWSQVARGALSLLRCYPLEFFGRLFGKARRAIHGPGNILARRLSRWIHA
jgi:hypothetical protein